MILREVRGMEERERVKGGSSRREVWERYRRGYGSRRGGWLGGREVEGGGDCRTRGESERWEARMWKNEDGTKEGRASIITLKE
jgi:hypothetical protein